MAYSYTGDQLTDSREIVDRTIARGVVIDHGTTPMPAAPSPNPGSSCPQPREELTFINSTDPATIIYPQEDMLVLATPAGPASLTRGQYADQLLRVQEASRRMGGVYVSTPDYVRHFGLLDTDHAFGRHVWSGLLNFFAKYPYKYRFDGGRLMMGWFQAPHNFGCHTARTLVDRDRDYMFYPACFIMWGESPEEVAMACEAILLRQSRPWWVHISRVRNARPVEAHEFSEAHRQSAIQNCWAHPVN